MANMWSWCTRDGGFGMVFPVLIIVLVVLLVVALVKSAGESKQQEQSEEGPETALDILEKRYARGEIDDEEFTHKKQQLQE